MLPQVKNIIAQLQDEQRRRLLLIAAGAAILLVLDIFFIFLPLAKRHFRLRSQIISMKDNIASLERQISIQNVAIEKLSTLKDDEARYRDILPKEEEVPALIGDLSIIAGKVGVDIIAVKPVRRDPGAPQKEAMLFDEVPIEISGKGGYHQLGQFINRLEIFGKLIEIKDVEIKTDKATPRRHFFRLLASTYILKG